MASFSEFGCSGRSGSAPTPVLRIVSITRYKFCLRFSISAEKKKYKKKDRELD